MSVSLRERLQTLRDWFSRAPLGSANLRARLSVEAMEDRTTPAVVQGEVWVTRATDTGPVAETVAGVQLRLTPESGASLVAVTNSAGQFDFIDVPVGAYSVEWTVPTGYRVSVEAPTQLVVGETLLNLSAELLSEPTLELQSASVSGIVWFDSDGDG